MAKSLGYSRVRITQLLNLLSLSGQVLEQIRASGDYWVRPLVTERKLRALLALQGEEQIYEIEKILEKSTKARKRQRCMTLVTDKLFSAILDKSIRAQAFWQNLKSQI